MVISNHSEETLTQTVVKEAIDEVSTLVLYNDDVHTFDYVIETLVRVCEHTYEQAEQLCHYRALQRQVRREKRQLRLPQSSLRSPPRGRSHRNDRRLSCPPLPYSTPRQKL